MNYLLFQVLDVMILELDMYARRCVLKAVSSKSLGNIAMTEELEPSAKKSCADCDLGLLAFGYRYLGNAELCFQYLVGRGVLRDQATCKKCGELYQLYFNHRVFECQNLVHKAKKKPQRRNFQQSVHRNTWLHNGHLDIESNVLFIQTTSHTKESKMKSLEYQTKPLVSGLCFAEIY